MTPAEQRFAELLSLALDGVATDADRAEFAQLEEDHPELLVPAVEEIFTHNLLAWHSEDISDCMLLELAAHEQNNLATRPASWLGRNSRRHFFVAAAAAIFFAAAFIIWQGISGQSSNLQIAEVVDQQDVVWSADSSALHAGNVIVPGRLQNESGSFTLRFESGPTMRVTGPASLDLRSAMLVYLDRGQATARVPQSGKGFAIQTPVAKLVDQGTEFGVIARDDGKTDVIVFEGRVDLHETSKVAASPRSLTIGDAARIDSRGSVDRIMEMGRDTSGGWWTNKPHSSEHLIAGVTDNIVSDISDMFTCYQITYGGLQEDALAYADNPNHQWNGLTAEGLPEFLRGADYIKTFNDYRYRQDYELTIEIARPTNLYVFADNRIPPPKWLKERFEDTGVEIGLDEGRWLRQAPDEYRALDKNSTAIGGGQSIDNTFTVWKRRCTQLGPVTLGDAGKWATEGKQGRAMYGIAATPLD